MKSLKSELLRLLKEDEEFRYAVAGLIGLEEILKRLEEHDRKFKEILERLDKHEAGLARLWAETNKLREDMNKGFDLLRRHVDALGARWGMMTEEAFREGLRGILTEELGLIVERWTAYDEEGLVYGHPSPVEVDVAVRNGRVVLVEISSYVRASDEAAFAKKAKLYAKKTAGRPTSSSW